MDPLGLEDTKTILSLTTVKDNEMSGTIVVAMDITGARRKNDMKNVIQLPRVK